tara:strand:- start:1794 stop:2045 length:252 start_codon:yes stop_codon:yes gene_type:complete
MNNQTPDIENQLEENQQNNEWKERIDKYIDKWFENNKDDVDIGKITAFKLFGQSIEIDVLPDELEKAIYKKIFKIAISLIKDL